MSRFTAALSRLNPPTHRASAKITAIQSNGYAAQTTTNNIAILLTSTTEYSVNDVVFYNVKTREIIELSKVSSWTNLPV